MAQNMEKDSISFQMESHMMVTLKTISSKVKELSNCQTDNTRVHLTKEKCKVMAFLLGKMGRDMKVITKIIENMVKASIFLQMERNMKAIGKMEYVRGKVF